MEIHGCFPFGMIDCHGGFSISMLVDFSSGTTGSGDDGQKRVIFHMAMEQPLDDFPAQMPIKVGDYPAMFDSRASRSWNWENV
jgi:hypothetical protein